MIKLHARSLLALLVLLPLAAWSQNERPPVTRTYFIDQAFIVTQPGTTIDMGAVIIRDGLIQAVGKNLKAPADAKVIEGDSLYVYAGFIDGLS
ncbi:MAG: amidohydrolase, partial [Bacteroidota bacterium]